MTFDPASPENELFDSFVIDGEGATATPAVACPSTSQCTVVGGVWQRVTFNPTSEVFSTPATIDSGGNMTGIACPSTAQCTVVDGGGREVTFNPTSPGSPTPTMIDAGNALSAVSCPSTSFCVAVDGAGNAVEGDPTPGGSWTVDSLQTGDRLTSVFCSSVVQCVAVDATGHAFVGAGARSTATSASCVPNRARPGQGVICTATVSDTATGTPSTPTGTVGWTVQSGAGTLSAASSTLSGGFCSVTYTSAAGQQAPQVVGASYGGDKVHQTSSTTNTLVLLVANPDGYATAKASTLTVAAPGVLGNDLPSSDITANLVSGPANGALALSANGSFTYTPHSGFVGTDSFTYSAIYTATGLVSNPAKVTISVIGSGFSCPGCNLSGLNLSGDTLSNATLTGTNLSGTNLTGANLKNANLKNANLTNANLTNANLKGANMTGATLAGIIWSNATCPDGTNSTGDGGTCIGHL